MNKRGAYQKRARNIENVEAREKLLLASKLQPATIGLVLSKALVSQRAFASMALPGKNITPLSLNTLKTIAAVRFAKKDEVNGDGFEYLDGLRLQLKDVVGNPLSGRSLEEKAAKKKKENEELSATLGAVESHNIRQSKAYFDLFDKINTLVKSGTIEAATKIRIINILEAHCQLFGELFHPNGADITGEVAVLLSLPRTSER